MSGFELVIGHNLKGQLEALREFVLPLLGETAGANNKAPFEVAASDQFLDEQPRHDGLTGTRIVGEEEAQWLAR